MTERGEIHSGRIALDLNEKFGAGDGDRTRNFQLGKVNTALFIFNTYKTAQEKYACMLRIPCMHCLICVSLRDVCGTVCHGLMEQSTLLDQANGSSG